jgi:bacterioferritin
MMDKYLLVLFSYAGLENLNNFLLNKLNSGDKLFVRAVMLKGVPRLFSHLTSEVGFLGDKVASDVEDSVVDIYYENARDYLKEIEEKAVADGIEIDKDLIENHQIDKLKSVIRDSDFDAVIINFSNNEFVSDQVKEKEIKKWLNTIEKNKYIFHDGKRG